MIYRRSIYVPAGVIAGFPHTPSRVALKPAGSGVYVPAGTLVIDGLAYPPISGGANTPTTGNGMPTTAGTNMASSASAAWGSSGSNSPLRPPIPKIWDLPPAVPPDQPPPIDINGTPQVLPDQPQPMPLPQLPDIDDIFQPPLPAPPPAPDNPGVVPFGPDGGGFSDRPILSGD